MTSYEPKALEQITITYIAILIVIAILLAVILITLICFAVKCSKNQKNLIQKKLEISNNDLTETEKQILAKYQKLDDMGKTLVNQTLQTLNTKNKE